MAKRRTQTDTDVDEILAGVPPLVAEPQEDTLAGEGEVDEFEGRGVGLRKSEWGALEKVCEEEGFPSRNALVRYIVVNWLRDYENGSVEIEREEKKMPKIPD
jgi:hypothetical protein